jgi:hypothetical protein
MRTNSTVNAGTPVLRVENRLGLIVRLARAVMKSAVDGELRTELLARLLEYEEYASLKQSVPHSVAPSSMPASGSAPFPLLVTTGSGLFVLHGNQWRCLLPSVCFGLAREGNTIYLGASAGIHSFVLAAMLPSPPHSCALSDLRILFRYETRYSNERIHQIAFDPRKRQIVCANSRRNSLLVVDCDSGALVDEKFLVSDRTGFPIYNDQNHINSVTVHGDILLFAAHTAGSSNGAALGFVADDWVHAYQFESRGVHDVLIHDDGLMFTDSFRDSQVATRPDVNGAVRFRGQEYLAGETDRVPGKLMLRGLAARDGVLAVGYSSNAPREARRAAVGGGVMVLTKGVGAVAIAGPFSQVYDVLPFDGQRSDRTGTPRSVAQLDELFRRDVGPLLYQAPVVRGFRLTKLK